MAAGTALRSSWRTAPATWGLAAVTALIWVVSFAAQWSEALVLHASFLPERLVVVPGGEFFVPAWLTPLTALFVHAGFIHLAVNLIALVLFGRAVEPAVGAIGLLLLYVAGALAAVATFFVIPPIGLRWVGAGGGIAAVLGGYAILFGRSRAPAKARLARWAYILWLCVGWTLLSLLVLIAFAGVRAVYYAPAFIAAFAIGLPLGRPLLLFRYRKA